MISVPNVKMVSMMFNVSTDQMIKIENIAINKQKLKQHRHASKELAIC